MSLRHAGDPVAVGDLDPGERHRPCLGARRLGDRDRPGQPGARGNGHRRSLPYRLRAGHGRTERQTLAARTACRPPWMRACRSVSASRVSWQDRTGAGENRRPTQEAPNVWAQRGRRAPSAAHGAGVRRRGPVHGDGAARWSRRRPAGAPPGRPGVGLAHDRDGGRPRLGALVGVPARRSPRRGAGSGRPLPPARQESRSPGGSWSP